MYLLILISSLYDYSHYKKKISVYIKRRNKKRYLVQKLNKEHTYHAYLIYTLM